MAKDIHTEHCCIVHGCKYGEEDCTVMQKKQPQSHRCELCDEEGMDPTQATDETSIYNFKPGEYYKLIRDESKGDEKGNPALLYVMGFMKNCRGEARIICEVFLVTDFVRTLKLDFVSSIQGVDKIMKSQWEKISPEKFEKLKEEYTKEIRGDKPFEVSEEFKKAIGL